MLDLELRFNLLYSRWRLAGLRLKTMDELMSDPSYLEIKGMGKDALPFIFKRMVHEPFRWSRLLKELTNDNPIPKDHRGRAGMECIHWLSWARSHGFEPGRIPNDLPIMVLDLELTCWESNVGKLMEIIEIGTVMLSPDREIMSEYSTCVRPIVEPILSDYCRSLTGITQDEVDAAPRFAEAMTGLNDWCAHVTHFDLSNVILCAWGSDGDGIFRECARHNVDFPIRYQRNLKDEHAITKGLRRPIGLRKALELEGINFEGNQHRALSDAKNTAALFVKLWPKEDAQP